MEQQDISELIRSRGFDQRTFAKKCKLTQGVISNYITGELVHGKPSTFKKFVKALSTKSSKVVYLDVWKAYKETRRRKRAALDALKDTPEAVPIEQ